MVDLALMAKLLRALRPEARLVLLGDKDQLASVEAGAVLGRRVRRRARLLAGVRRTGRQRRRASPCRPARAAAARRCATAVVLLRDSRRFTAASGIARWRRRSTAATATAPSRSSRAAPPTSAGSRTPARRARRDALAAAAAGRVRALPRASSRAGAPAGGGAPGLRGASASSARTAPARRASSRRQPRSSRTRSRRGASSVRRAHRAVVRRPARDGDAQRSRLRLSNGDVGIVLPDPRDAGTRRGRVSGRGRRGASRVAGAPAGARDGLRDDGAQEPGLGVRPRAPAPAARAVARGDARAALHGHHAGATRVEVWGSEAVVRAGVAARVERSSGLRDALWDG